MRTRAATPPPATLEGRILRRLPGDAYLTRGCLVDREALWNGGDRETLHRTIATALERLERDGLVEHRIEYSERPGGGRGGRNTHFYRRRGGEAR